MTRAAFGDCSPDRVVHFEPANEAEIIGQFDARCGVRQAALFHSEASNGGTALRISRINGNRMVVLAAALIASCSDKQPALHDFAINCQKLARAEFDERIQLESSRGVSRSAEGSRVTTIKFHVDKASTQDALISIYSDRAGPAPLYHGKFAGAVEVFPNNEFFQGQGLDNLHFKFFELKNLRVCSQRQDGGASYWQQGKNVRIEFLTEKDTDLDIGTPIGHRVHLE